MKKKVNALIADTKPYKYSNTGKTISKSADLLSKYTDSKIVVDLNHSNQSGYKARVGVIEKSELAVDGDITKLIAKKISFYDKDTIQLIKDNPKGFGFSAEFIPDEGGMLQKEDGTYEIKDGAIWSVAIVQKPRHQEKDLAILDSSEYDDLTDITFYDDDESDQDTFNKKLESFKMSIIDKVKQLLNDNKTDKPVEPSNNNTPDKVDKPVEDTSKDKVDNSFDKDAFSVFQNESVQTMELLATKIQEMSAKLKKYESLEEKITKNDNLINTLITKREETYTPNPNFNVPPSVTTTISDSADKTEEEKEVARKNLKSIKTILGE